MNLKEGARTFYIVVRNLVLGGNLISLAQWRRPRAMLYYVGECLFLYKSMHFKRKLKQKAVCRILGCQSVEEIRLGNLKESTWLISNPSFVADLVSLCLICRAVQPKVVFEIGTQTGYTSFHFALNSPEDAHVYTLDLPNDAHLDAGLKTTLADISERYKTEGVKGMCFAGTEWERKITCLKGDSATYDFTPYHTKVDLFFVDGAHSYEYVRSDTLNALKCCHPGSVIVWHDYARVGLGGVNRWLHEFAKEGREIYCVPGGSVAYMTV